MADDCWAPFAFCRLVGEGQEALEATAKGMCLRASADCVCPRISLKGFLSANALLGQVHSSVRDVLYIALPRLVLRISLAPWRACDDHALASEHLASSKGWLARS